MDNQPTEVETKEFWKWCGFKPAVAAVSEERFWYYPDGMKPHHLLPSINIEHLFRWAIPKVKSKIGGSMLHYHLHTWLEQICFEPNIDPTLALFWAIWEVIHGQAK